MTHKIVVAIVLILIIVFLLYKKQQAYENLTHTNPPLIQQAKHSLTGKNVL